MNTILAFLTGCIMLAVCVWVGGLVLNIVLAIVGVLIAGSLGVISWICQKLSGD